MSIGEAAAVSATNPSPAFNRAFEKFVGVAADAGEKKPNPIRQG